MAGIRFYGRPGKFSGRDAGKKAKPVWVCANLSCEAHYQTIRDPASGKLMRAVDQCPRCGSLAFEYFASTGEANRWAQLRLQQKIGELSNLRRQVRIPLFAIGPNGLQVWVADYVADYVYDLPEEKDVIEDHKPLEGMDREARLKLKWVQAQTGKPVRIHET